MDHLLAFSVTMSLAASEDDSMDSHFLGLFNHELCCSRW